VFLVLWLVSKLCSFVYFLLSEYNAMLVSHKIVVLALNICERCKLFWEDMHKCVKRLMRLSCYVDSDSML